MKLLRSIYSSPTYSNKLIVLRIIIFDATINNYSNKVLEGILISSITKSPLMVITLNTRRVKAVYRLDSKPSKPANSREIYRLIHVVLGTESISFFTTFYTHDTVGWSNRGAGERREKGHEHRVRYVYIRIYTRFTASWRMLSRRYL